jgi:hypothetical protein
MLPSVIGGPGGSAGLRIATVWHMPPHSAPRATAAQVLHNTALNGLLGVACGHFLFSKPDAENAGIAENPAPILVLHFVHFLHPILKFAGGPGEPG